MSETDRNLREIETSKLIPADDSHNYKQPATLVSSKMTFLNLSYSLIFAEPTIYRR